VAVIAYDPESWTDLFVASAGAAAALTGLLFVAVSINLKEILSLAGVPARAMETLMLLLSVVIVSIFALAPGQSLTALGLEVGVVGLVTAVAAARLIGGATMPPDAPRSWKASRLLLAAPATLPFLIGGISLIAESGGGLYWLLAGTVAAIVVGVINAWVLLVEILR
jgi:modulator of FtsH protease